MGVVYSFTAKNWITQKYLPAYYKRKQGMCIYSVQGHKPYTCLLCFMQHLLNGQDYQSFGGLHIGQIYVGEQW